MMNMTFFLSAINIIKYFRYNCFSFYNNNNNVVFELVSSNLLLSIHYFNFYNKIQLSSFFSAKIFAKILFFYFTLVVISINLLSNVYVNVEIKEKVIDEYSNTKYSNPRERLKIKLRI